jgi:putative FmdB family regulatory protein
MPIYEYVCLECNNTFDALRSFQQADEPIACSHCSSMRTSRKISRFYAHSEGRSVAGTGNSCNTCGASTCSTCGVPH